MAKKINHDLETVDDILGTYFRTKKRTDKHTETILLKLSKPEMKLVKESAMMNDYNVEELIMNTLVDTLLEMKASLRYIELLNRRKNKKRVQHIHYKGFDICISKETETSYWSGMNNSYIFECQTKETALKVMKSEINKIPKKVLG